MEIKQILVSEILPYPKNAKKHPKDQIVKIANSIKEFGFNQPLVVDKNNVLIVGHGRLQAAKELGLDSVPCLQVTNLTEEQTRLYRLADNKLNESEWDMELVIEEIKDLHSLEIDITPSGFEIDILPPEKELNEDIVFEPPAQPKTKFGDVYLMGDHVLICGDSTSIDTVNKLMGDNLADLVFTDPPYNIDYDFSKNGMVETGQRKAKHGKIKNDNMSDEEFNVFITNVLSNLFIFLKDGGSFYVSAGRESTITFNRILLEQNLKISQWLIWVKEHFNISRLDYHPSHEVITYGWKPKAAHNWFSDRKQKDVLNFSRDENAIHPTQKPVALIEYLINNSSKQNDVVLDFFGGSGATLIAAEKTNRKARIIELDPAYCDAIVARWEHLTGRKSLIQ